MNSADRVGNDSKTERDRCKYLAKALKTLAHGRNRQTGDFSCRFCWQRIPIANVVEKQQMWNTKIESKEALRRRHSAVAFELIQIEMLTEATAVAGRMRFVRATRPKLVSR